MERLIDILLVEDNPADAKLMARILGECKTKHALHVTRDGVQALEFLGAEKEVPARSVDLIILDLNLPRKDGRQLLRQLKVHPLLKRIPVIVLTTSGAEADVAMSYDLYANCYIKKPATLEEYREVISSIEKFWLITALLPTFKIALD